MDYKNELNFGTATTRDRELSMSPAVRAAHLVSHPRAYKKDHDQIAVPDIHPSPCI